MPFGDPPPEDLQIPLQSLHLDEPLESSCKLGDAGVEENPWKNAGFKGSDKHMGDGCHGL